MLVLLANQARMPFYFSNVFFYVEHSSQRTTNGIHNGPLRVHRGSWFGSETK